MSELRDHIGGTAQNVTGIVDALERDGEAIRRPHTSDRRKTMISIAASTRAEVLSQREDHREAIAALFDALSENERESFHGTLIKLVAELEDDA